MKTTHCRIWIKDSLSMKRNFGENERYHLSNHTLYNISFLTVSYNWKTIRDGIFQNKERHHRVVESQKLLIQLNFILVYMKKVIDYYDARDSNLFLIDNTSLAFAITPKKIVENKKSCWDYCICQFLCSQCEMRDKQIDIRRDLQ
jgi:hypothetical protein